MEYVIESNESRDKMEAVKARAEYLGLEARHPRDLKPGYYMDLACNLSVINVVKYEEKGPNKADLDCDVDAFQVNDAIDELNALGLLYWEFLGDL